MRLAQFDARIAGCKMLDNGIDSLGRTVLEILCYASRTLYNRALECERSATHRQQNKTIVEGDIYTMNDGSVMVVRTA